jgi:hypothetical protein
MVWDILIGREAKGDYYDPKTWEVFLRAGERIDKSIINRLEMLELVEVEAKLQGIEAKLTEISHRVTSPRKIEDKSKRTHRVLPNSLHRVTSPREITFCEIELDERGRIRSETLKTVRCQGGRVVSETRQTIRPGYHHPSHKKRRNYTVVTHRGKRESVPCRVKGCNKTFATVADMEQHVKSKHTNRKDTMFKI